MMDLNRLKDEFPPEDIEWRVQSSGLKDNRPWALIVPYVRNRAIMDRLDEVCSPENWKNEFAVGPGGGVMCGISVLIPLGADGTFREWVTKWDGAENSDIEPVKGGLSNAMKRAAVQWGIGRYLYHLGTAWADFCADGENTLKMKEDGRYYKWNSPGSTPKPRKEEKRTPPPAPSGEGQGTPSRAPAPQVIGDDPEYQMRKEINEWGLTLAGGDKDELSRIVQRITSFKDFPGYDNIDKAKGTPLRIAHGKIKKEYNAAMKARADAHTELVPPEESAAAQEELRRMQEEDKQSGLPF